MSLRALLVLLSTRALKLPASDGWSSRADLARVLWSEILAAMSGTLTTGGPSR
jgi:hypothetical protein